MRQFDPFDSRMKPFRFRKGPVFFKSGGGSSGDTYDAAYNARMASIAEQQQSMANQYFKFWESDYQPMEQAQIQANMEMIPGETALNKAQNEANLSLIPGQTQLAMGQTDSALSLLPMQTDFTKAQIQDATTAMGERAPVRNAFYQQAAEGVDVNSMADRAAADAVQSFSNSNAAIGRNMARMGVNPTSGRFAAMTNQNAIDQAKTVAGARTQARTQGEDINFKRLNTAMGYGG